MVAQFIMKITNRDLKREIKTVNCNRIGFQNLSKLRMIKEACVLFFIFISPISSSLLHFAFIPCFLFINMVMKLHV